MAPKKKSKDKEERLYTYGVSVSFDMQYTFTEKEVQPASAVCLQMVLDKLDQKLREGFRAHINLSCLFSKSQSVILLPS